MANTINDIMKAAGIKDINDVKELAQDINYIKLIMLISQLDHKKIKKAFGDVDVNDAIKAAQEGDIQKLQKIVKKVDWDALVDVLDKDEDGDIADDIKKMIKQVRK